VKWRLLREVLVLEKGQAHMQCTMISAQAAHSSATSSQPDKAIWYRASLSIESSERSWGESRLACPQPQLHKSISE
jgi:hypothetical protein